MRRFLYACILTIVSSICGAQSLPDNVITSRVLPGWQEADGTRIVGLELTLADGWKTYWRSPGDAGIPPRFDFSRARNLAGAEVLWPSPEVFWQAGMRSVGYARRVVLPLRLTPKRQQKDIRLRGVVDLGVCADICVPMELTFDTVVEGSKSHREPALVAAMASLPYTESEAGVGSVTCAIQPETDGMRVTARIDMPPAGRSEVAVIEAHRPDIWVSEPRLERRSGTLELSARMILETGGAMSVNRSGMRFTIIGSDYAVDVQGCTG